MGLIGALEGEGKERVLSRSQLKSHVDRSGPIGRITIYEDR